jgi:hypothetical protein
MHFVFKYLRFSRFGIHAYLSRFAFWTTWRKSRRGAGIVILTTGGNEYLVPLLPVSPLVRRLPVEIWHEVSKSEMIHGIFDCNSRAIWPPEAPTAWQALARRGMFGNGVVPKPPTNPRFVGASYATDVDTTELWNGTFRRFSIHKESAVSWYDRSLRPISWGGSWPKKIGSNME